MTKTPSMFSDHNSSLQMVWDSTSLKALMFCPTFYKRTILEGWRSKGAVDLEFGIMFASAVETFKKGRLEGLSKVDAQLASLKKVLEDSWLPGGNTGHCPCPDGCNGCEQPDGKPWGGSYEDLWHCTGTEPYKNSKGNKAKCPWSHKGKWFPAPAPSTCGECGSETETHRHWLPADKTKNRVSLVRAIIWYTEDQPDTMYSGGLKPFAFPDGVPAVELSFKLPLDYANRYDEPYILAGHIDSILQNEDGSELFIADNKTTKKFLGKAFQASFSPNIQMDVYDLAGSILFPTLPIRGVAIEAAQILHDGARFATYPLHRTEAQREETLTNLSRWFDTAEEYAESQNWPMSTANCWLCPLKGICSKDPSQRELYLRADFEQKFWNPLDER